jgi:hypothetical protein
LTVTSELALQSPTHTVMVGVAVGTGLGVSVGVPVAVGVIVGVRVWVAVGCGLGVAVDVAVTVGDAVGVAVGGTVGVGGVVGVRVGVAVGAVVGVRVGVEVDVPVTVAVGVMVAVAVGVKLTHRPVVPLHDAPKTGAPPPGHCPLVGGPQVFWFWQQSCAPGIGVDVAVGVRVTVGVAVFVNVGVMLGVGVRVGVKAPHWPVVPLQNAPNTTVLPAGHCPPFGGPQAFDPWQQSSDPGVRVAVDVGVGVRVGVLVGVGVAVSVGVVVNVLVAVGVGVNPTHWPVAPLQKAPYTTVPPWRHCPPAVGGPQIAWPWQQSWDPAVRVGVTVDVLVWLGVGVAVPVGCGVEVWVGVGETVGVGGDVKVGIGVVPTWALKTSVRLSFRYDVTMKRYVPPALAGMVTCETIWLFATSSLQATSVRFAHGPTNALRTVS